MLVSALVPRASYVRKNTAPYGQPQITFASGQHRETQRILLNASCSNISATIKTIISVGGQAFVIAESFNLSLSLIHDSLWDIDLSGISGHHARWGFTFFVDELARGGLCGVNSRGCRRRCPSSGEFMGVGENFNQGRTDLKLVRRPY